MGFGKAKKLVFDVECMPHLFVMSYRMIIGYDAEPTIHSVHTPQDAYKVMREYEDYLWIGYFSNGYDDYILSEIERSGGECTPEELAELSTELIESQNKRPRKYFLSYDCFDPIEAGMRSLKMYCGSSGKPTYDSPYSFKDDIHYNASQVRDIEMYCEQDVDWTTEVFLRERAFYEASMARVDILEDAGIEMNDPLRIVCCKSASFARYLFESLCAGRCADDNYRTTFKLINDLSDSKYQEVRAAYAFYKKIKDDGDEYTSAAIFYNKERTPSFDTLVGLGGAKRSDMGVNLGWGGAHGSLNGYVFNSDDTPSRALRYVDVSSMYPTLLVRHDLFPSTFTDDAKDVYTYFYKARLVYKKNGEAIKCAASKRIINSLTGMLKDQFATFRSEWSNNSIVINGQLAILELACMLNDNVGFKLVQVNTDGIMVETDSSDVHAAIFNDLVEQWSKKWDFDVASKLISVLVQTNVNNYYMRLVGHDDDERKGAAYAYNEGYFRDVLVVKKILPILIMNHIAEPKYISPDLTLKRAEKKALMAKYEAERLDDVMSELALMIEDGSLNIMDFLVLIKVTDTFPFLYDVVSDTFTEARCIRCIAAQDSKRSRMVARNHGLENNFRLYQKCKFKDPSAKMQKVTNFPDIALELPDNMSDYDPAGLFAILDLEYYAKRLIKAIDIFYTGEDPS